MSWWYVGGAIVACIIFFQVGMLVNEVITRRRRFLLREGLRRWSLAHPRGLLHPGEVAGYVDEVFDAPTSYIMRSHDIELVTPDNPTIQERSRNGL